MEAKDPQHFASRPPGMWFRWKCIILSSNHLFIIWNLTTFDPPGSRPMIHSTSPYLTQCEEIHFNESCISFGSGDKCIWSNKCATLSAVLALFFQVGFVGGAAVSFEVTSSAFSFCANRLDYDFVGPNKVMKEWMNDRINGWMNDRINRWMIEWMAHCFALQLRSIKPFP